MEMILLESGVQNETLTMDNGYIMKTRCERVEVEDIIMADETAGSSRFEFRNKCCSRVIVFQSKKCFLNKWLCNNILFYTSGLV